MGSCEKWRHDLVNAVVDTSPPWPCGQVALSALTHIALSDLMEGCPDMATLPDDLNRCLAPFGMTLRLLQRHGHGPGPTLHELAECHTPLLALITSPNQSDGHWIAVHDRMAADNVFAGRWLPVEAFRDLPVFSSWLIVR
jgi:hypothetical protein